MKLSAAERSRLHDLVDKVLEAPVDVDALHYVFAAIQQADVIAGPARLARVMGLTNRTTFRIYSMRNEDFPPPVFQEAADSDAGWSTKLWLVDDLESYWMEPGADGKPQLYNGRKRTFNRRKL